jgi:hypothetical protein
LTNLLLLLIEPRDETILEIRKKEITEFGIHTYKWTIWNKFATNVSLLNLLTIPELTKEIIL